MDADLILSDSSSDLRDSSLSDCSFWADSEVDKDVERVDNCSVRDCTSVDIFPFFISHQLSVFTIVLFYR